MANDYTPISLIRGNSTVIDETSIVDGQILFDESRKCLFMDDGDTRSKYSGLGADSNVATVEDTTTSTHAYAKGDYVVVEGQLYEVTAAIAIGDTFTVGTNITQTTVGDELVQIKSDLTDYWHYVVGTSTSDTSWLRYKSLGGVCYLEGNIGPITITTTFSQFINDNTLPTPDGKAECSGVTGIGLVPLLVEVTSLGGLKIAAQSTATDNYATFCIAYPIG